MKAPGTLTQPTTDSWTAERSPQERASLVNRLAERAGLLTDPEFSDLLGDYSEEMY